jgi:hypothetical protein
LSYPGLLTANDTWVHHFEPETKSRPCKGTILNLPGRKNFGKSPASGKVKIAVFLDCDGVIVVTLLSRGQTLISNAYFRPLKELGKYFVRIWFHKTFYVL